MTQICQLRVLTVLIFLAVPALLSATSLVTNGDFETGNFSGWTHSGFANLICSPGFAESGNCAVDLDGDDGVLSQVITTVAGDSYTFDFWYWLAGEQFSVKWDGQVVFSSDVSGDWTHEILPDLIATTDSTTIEFDATTFSTPPMRVDDVNVVADAPEPSTLFTFVAGLAVIAFGWRRKWESAN